MSWIAKFNNIKTARSEVTSNPTGFGVFTDPLQIKSFNTSAQVSLNFIYTLIVKACLQIT
jgi:hypothetical protein